MSDDTTPAVSDPSADHFAMLDLDLPDEAPVLPAWATAVIAAIRAIVVGLTLETADAAFVALATAIEPVKAQPEGIGRTAVRTAKDAKLAEINRVRAAARVMQPATAPVMAPAAPLPPTVEQAIPIITTSAPKPREFSATWGKLPGGTEWGARLDRSNLAVPVPGDAVNIRNAAGTSVKRRYLGEQASNGVYTVTLDSPIAAPAMHAATMAANVAAAAEVAATMAPAHDVAEASDPTEARSTLTAELAGIASEANANANAGTMGTIAGGQMRGVGFSSADGYVRALANGVKLATAEEYKRTLRSAYSYSAEQIAALTVTIIPENDLPVGPGITHIPVGPSWADMTPAQRRAMRKVGEETRTKVKALLSEGQLIAGAVAAGSALQVSWTGAGTTTLGKVRAALAEIGREHDAPTAPSAVRHAGRAVDSLRSSEIDTARLPGAELPNGTKAQWVVGDKLGGKAVQVGEGYNKAKLIVSLSDSDVLTFEGDTHLAAKVRAHYETATANEVLKSEDLTSWLGGVLFSSHYAVKRGHLWYVPGGYADAARLLTETIGKLWGDHERIPVTSGPDLMRALTRGLSDECAVIAAELTKCTDIARDRAERDAAAEVTERARRMRTMVSADALADATRIARERATVSPVIAARLMVSLAEVAARVSGYAMVLGEDSTKDITAKIADLRNQIEPLCNDTAQRASMLELS